VGGGSHAPTESGYVLTIRMVRKRPPGEGPAIHDAAALAYDLRLAHGLPRLAPVGASGPD
jgi:hypothetical protein